MPVGTPDDMAPEVWLGEPPGRRTDVDSLGALRFELLAGAPPFADVEPAAAALGGSISCPVERREITGPTPARRPRNLYNT
ncbi:MAG TPA: hypothetical protein VF516_16390 [Kofleriaceae bacterium]